MEYLQWLFNQLPTRDQRLVNEGLQIGRVISEFQDHRGYGDFLIRGVLGQNPENEALCVGDFFRTGQTVQFHVRDHASADQDLRQWLQRLARQLPGGSRRGGLLFTCNGRGTNLFPQPDHDAGAIQQLLGPMPLAGFFAAGEIGPVGGKNFVHGYTASLVVFGE
jgi:small ligand-binding sensory domain FIST